MTRNRSYAARSLAPAEPRIDEERDTLLRAIGHELRSPLTAMSLGIDLVQRDSPSKARILATMKWTVQRMDRLIEELLLHARGDMGDAVTTREAVAVHVRLLKGDRP